MATLYSGTPVLVNGRNGEACTPKDLGLIFFAPPPPSAPKNLGLIFLPPAPYSRRIFAKRTLPFYRVNAIADKYCRRLEYLILNQLWQPECDIGELKGGTFIVAGHTDAKGGDTYNQGSSERRADAVQTFPGGKIRHRAGQSGHGRLRQKPPEERRRSDVGRQSPGSGHQRERQVAAPARPLAHGPGNRATGCADKWTVSF
jgi:hypothetical protein